MREIFGEELFDLSGFHVTQTNASKFWANKFDYRVIKSQPDSFDEVIATFSHFDIYPAIFFGNFGYFYKRGFYKTIFQFYATSEFVNCGWGWFAFDFYFIFFLHSKTWMR